MIYWAISSIIRVKLDLNSLLSSTQNFVDVLTFIIIERGASFPLYTPRLRRINFHRFPYHILFEILDDEIIHVVVVKHDSRDPDLGLDR
jgi:hypothetical protein